MSPRPMDSRQRARATSLDEARRALRACGVAAVAAVAFGAGCATPPPLPRSPTPDSPARGELRAAAREHNARVAEAYQAARRPNPVLAVELEDFAGTGNTGAYDAAQTTVWLGQRLEISGKRGARVREAELAVDLADADHDLLARRIDAEVDAARVRALAAREDLRLARAAEDVARSFHATVSERVAAGKVSPVEERKAAVALANKTLLVSAGERAWEGARRELARAMGHTRVPDIVAGELETATEPPPLAELLARLETSPRLRRWDLERARREARVDSARAARRPDLDLRAGVRRIHEIDETAAVVALELPLPLFDRGRGELVAARERLLQVEDERDAQRLELETRLRDAWSRQRTAWLELSSLDKDVLPNAELVVTSVEDGYRQGKFELLDVLDAQRTRFEAHARRVEALASYHLARVELETLLGGGIGEQPDTGRAP